MNSISFRAKIIVSVLALFAGLGGLSLYFENLEPVPVSIIRGIVVSQHANHPPVLSSSAIISEIAEVINKEGGYLTLVNAGGVPSVLGTPALIPRLSDNTQAALSMRLNDPDGPFAVIDLIDTAVPSTGEVDYLAAIGVTSIPMQEAIKKETKAGNAELNIEMIVDGSGLSTVGEIDFTADILDRYRNNYQALAEKLVLEDALPNLKGIHVVWVSFGEVAAPQDKIPASVVKEMKLLWKTALLAAGAESVEFRDALPRSGNNSVDSGFPWVTPIPFAPTAEDTWPPGPMLFTEKILGFVPNEAMYLDGEDGTKGETIAQQVLSPFVDHFINTGQVMLVVGTAWNDGTGEEFELAGNRALLVRDQMISMGVPSGQLIAVSAGNLGTHVQIGSDVYDFFIASQPEYSRAIWLVPLELGNEIVERFIVVS